MEHSDWDPNGPWNIFVFHHKYYNEASDNVNDFCPPHQNHHMRVKKLHAVHIRRGDLKPFLTDLGLLQHKKGTDAHRRGMRDAEELWNAAFQEVKDPTPITSQH